MPAARCIRRVMGVYNSPTTLLALCCPCADAAVWPSGMVVAAILVILIEEVFVASMALGLSSADRLRKMAFLRSRFSETAYERREVSCGVR